MTTITDYSQKELPQSIRDMLDGKHWEKPFKESVLDEVSALAEAKRRLQTLLYVEGQVDGSVLYRMAADEIESLRAQVEDHIANALVRANRQAIMVEALKHIREMSLYHTDREIATKVLTDIGELQ